MGSSRRDPPAPTGSTASPVSSQELAGHGLARPSRRTLHRSQRGIRLWASITSLTLLAVRDDALRLQAAGVDGLHLDLADGHFAPFLTFGPALACALRGELRIPIEAHLMVENPEDYIRQLARGGINRVAFHVESTRHPWRVASLGRSLGMEIGAAMNPVTAVSIAGALGRAVDYVNLLTTDHDFAGDRLLDGTVDRVRQACREVPTGVRIQVDGGVVERNVGSLVVAGADDLVVGRAICDQPDWTAAVAALRHSCISSIHHTEDRPGSRRHRTS